MSFEITFLGSSGGPIEGSNCCIIIKPKHISYEDIVSRDLSEQLLCVDAGSGLAKLSEIIYNESNGNSANSLLNLYSDSLNIDQYCKNPITHPFKSFTKTSPFQTSVNIFKNIKTYLITHPHLDHICSMVLNSPNFSVTNPKYVFGSSDTIDALNYHIFNGIIWPNMQEFNILKFNTIDYNKDINVNENYSVKMYKLSHGKLTSCDMHKNDHQKDTSSLLKVDDNPPDFGRFRHSSISITENFNFSQKITEENSITYLSSAYLINYKSLNSHILIFGDFESDLISNLNFNEIIWNEVSPLIVNNNLNTIILECSNLDLDNKLYGHLNPIYLIKELSKLKQICKQLTPSSTVDPFDNLNVIINHVKESDGSFDPRSSVLKDLESLNAQYGLNIKFSIALSGVSIIT